MNRITVPDFGLGRVERAVFVSKRLWLRMLSGVLSLINHEIGVPDRTRICNLLFRKQILYPIELRVQELVYPAGFELAALASQTRCSTRLSYE